MIGPDDITLLKAEFTKLAKISGKPCIRGSLHLSNIIRNLATSSTIQQHLDKSYQPVRCILFDKTPTHNWPVTWHQDLSIAVKEKLPTTGYTNWSIKEGVQHVQPPTSLLNSMTTVRIHLDAASADNGALKLIPNSHQLGKIDSTNITKYTSQETIHTCECKAGDILFMKPLILHASDKSKYPGHRRIIHIEYADPRLLDKNLTWYETITKNIPE